MISGVVIVAISIILTYVSKCFRNSVDKQKAIRAGTVAWHLFGTLVSQG